MAFLQTLLLLVLFTIISAPLMFTNLSYGLPYLFHPDEVIKLWLTGQIAQGNTLQYFNHPHFMLYFSAPSLVVSKAAGFSPLLGARAAVASLGVATTFIIFIIGRQLAGRLAGFTAALFYATAPLVVITSHDFKEDIPLAFWLTIQLFFLVRYFRGAQSRDLFFAAIAFGGAVGTKYTGFVAMPLLIGAVLLGPTSNRRLKMLAITALLAAVTFLFMTPSILWHPAKFLDGLSYEVQHAIFGHGIQSRLDGEGRLLVTYPRAPLKVSPVPYFWSYHLRDSLVPGISIAGLLLVSMGTFIAFMRGNRALRLVASGLLLFYFVLETLPLKPPPFAARYMVATLPYAAVLAGYTISFAREAALPVKAIIGVLFIGALGINGFESLQQVQAMRPETRDQARFWILKNIPHGARLILPGIVSYTPFAFSLERQDFPYDIIVPVRDPSFAKLLERLDFPYDIVRLQEPFFSKLLSESLEPDSYLMVSSFTYQRYFDFPDFDPEAHRFYRMLFERYSPLITFQVPFQAIGFHNPTIKVYHLADQ